MSHWVDLIFSRRAKEAVQIPEDAQLRLAALSGIRSVVFDVYGTLISSGVGDISLASEQDRDQTLKATLIDNDIRLTAKAKEAAFDDRLHDCIHSAQDLRRQEGVTYPEVEIREIWTTLLEQLTTDGYIEMPAQPDIETIVIDFESRVNPTQAMPGIEETLETLKKRALPLSIISNAQFYTPLLFDTYLKQSLSELGFSMNCSVWSYQEREGKPSTRLYEIAAEKLMTHYGIQPHETLYVGNDQRNDIWPAQSVGFKTALFAGDSLSLRRRKDDPNCANIEADLEITDLRQLLDCLH